MDTKTMIFVLLWFALWITAITYLAIHNNDGWAFLAFLVMISLSTKEIGNDDCKCKAKETATK